MWLAKANIRQFCYKFTSFYQAHDQNRQQQLRGRTSVFVYSSLNLSTKFKTRRKSFKLARKRKNSANLAF